LSLETDIALFRGIPLFAGLPTEQLRLMAFSAVRLELAQGQVLFREGSKAVSGYVVLSGAIQVTAGGEGKPKAVTCETGSLIGETALLVETRRPATATAIAPSQVLEIERKVILRMLNEYPDVATRMRGTLAERLAATIAQLAAVRAVLGGDRPRPAFPTRK
jgi:CRP-like cAMP-binding protein